MSNQTQLMQSKFSLLGTHLTFELIRKLFVILLGFELFYYDLGSQESISAIIFKIHPKQLMLV